MERGYVDRAKAAQHVPSTEYHYRHVYSSGCIAVAHLPVVHRLQRTCVVPVGQPSASKVHEVENLHRAGEHAAENG